MIPLHHPVLEWMIDTEESWRKYTAIALSVTSKDDIFLIIKNIIQIHKESTMLLFI